MILDNKNIKKFLSLYSLKLLDKQMLDLYNTISSQLHKGLTKLLSISFAILQIIVLIVYSIRSESKLEWIFPVLVLIFNLLLIILCSFHIFITFLQLKIIVKKHPNVCYWLMCVQIGFSYLLSIYILLKKYIEQDLDENFMFTNMRIFVVFLVLSLKYIGDWIINILFLLSAMAFFQYMNSQDFTNGFNLLSLFFEVVLFVIIYLQKRNQKQQFIQTFLQFKQLSLQQDVIDKLIPSSMIVLSMSNCKSPSQQQSQTQGFKQQLFNINNKKAQDIQDKQSQNGNMSGKNSQNNSNIKKFNPHENNYQPHNLMTWEEIKLEYANKKCQDLFKTSQLYEIKSKLENIIPFERQQQRQNIGQDDNQQNYTLLNDIIYEISTSQNHLKNQFLYPHEHETQNLTNEHIYQYDFEILEVMESKKNFIIEKQLFLAKYAVCIWSQKPCILVLFINESLQKRNNHLQQLNEYKDKLLATVSHDLKTPLNCIISVIDYLKTSFETEKQNNQQLSDSFQMQCSKNSNSDNKTENILLFSQQVESSCDQVILLNQSSQNQQNELDVLNLQTIDSVISEEVNCNQNKYNSQNNDIQKKQSMEYLQLIYNNSIMLLNMINDILDYSKFNSKIKIKPNISTFILADVIQEVFDIFSFQVQSKQVNLLLDSSCTLSLTTDRNRVKQIIMNLVSNSLKFTIQGHIKVSAVLIFEKNRIGITVEDTGIGMSSTIKSQLFNDFTTFNQENLNQNGIGLGLTICKKFVEMLGEGASFKVESEEGKGSKFSFEILHNFLSSDNCEAQNEFYAFNLIKDFEYAGESPLKNKGNDYKFFSKNTILESQKRFTQDFIDYHASNNTDNNQNDMKNSKNNIKDSQCDLQDGQFVNSTSLNNQEIILTNKRKSVFYTNNLQKIIHPEKENLVSEQDELLIPSELGQQELVNSTSAIAQQNSISHKVISHRLQKEIQNEHNNKKQKINVMIVDDSQYNLITLKLHLKPLSFVQVDEFLFAEEALKQFSSKHYDIIFSDVQMPIMDGIQFVKQIRQKGSQIHQPLIVMVSADAQDKYEEEMLNLSISAFISKPIIDKTKFQSILYSLIEKI